MFCLEMIITHISYGHHFMKLIFFYVMIALRIWIKALLVSLHQFLHPKSTVSITPDKLNHGSSTKPTQLSKKKINICSSHLSMLIFVSSIILSSSSTCSIFLACPALSNVMSCPVTFPFLYLSCFFSLSLIRTPLDLQRGLSSVSDTLNKIIDFSFTPSIQTENLTRFGPTKYSLKSILSFSSWEDEPLPLLLSPKPVSKSSKANLSSFCLWLEYCCHNVRPYSVKNHNILYIIKIIPPLGYSSKHCDCIIAKGVFSSWWGRISTELRIKFTKNQAKLVHNLKPTQNRAMDTALLVVHLWNPRKCHKARGKHSCVGQQAGGLDSRIQFHLRSIGLEFHTAKLNISIFLTPPSLAAYHKLVSKPIMYTFFFSFIKLTQITQPFLGLLSCVVVATTCLLACSHTLIHQKPKSSTPASLGGFNCLKCKGISLKLGKGLIWRCLTDGARMYNINYLKKTGKRGKSENQKIKYIYIYVRKKKYIWLSKEDDPLRSNDDLTDCCMLCQSFKRMARLISKHQWCLKNPMNSRDCLGRIVDLSLSILAFFHCSNVSHCGVFIGNGGENSGGQLVVIRGFQGIEWELEEVKVDVGFCGRHCGGNTDWTEDSEVFGIGKQGALATKICRKIRNYLILSFGMLLYFGKGFFGGFL
ncbi:hypothetical protein VP01_3902g2 [Puccinia sorghi]|uniref:Uncharacterized protein n=1 Tax=Puccinia sorghi TaxID=27349 RepID=A0A0L6UTI8_9BASI|nr:hypothetical protein VP01_3902g2 [Puccinia sorghi]